MARHFDRRRFGRRRSLIHALVVTSKGIQVPCLVRNISTGGALLEVESPHLLTRLLTLSIEADGFEADCEIRHRTQHGIGVLFSDVRIAATGRDTRIAGPMLEVAMQDVRISDLARS